MLPELPSACHGQLHLDCGRGEGGEGWSAGLTPSLGHIGRSIAAASRPVSHLLEEQGFLHYIWTWETIF